MKKRIRKIAMCVLVAVFVVSTALSLRQWKDNAGGETAYEDALSVAMQQPKENAAKGAQPASDASGGEEKEPVTVWVPAPVEGDPVMEEMAQINLAALREKNPDVVGWIRIPDTNVDYPLMQGEDNDFYLNHTWEKEPNSVGSIFLEYLNSPDLTDYNTIVYGHNMNNNSMFGDLEKFSLTQYWEAHPYVYIVSDAGVYRYEIFAFCNADVESLTYGMRPQRQDTKEKFLNLSLEASWIDTGIVPPVTDRILTLSTCSGTRYTHRYVVQARLPMVEVTQ
ncbi:MAG: class B sortase [Oscillospiraceae bacterium]|nr:class B sortase [Oscillospiraceae bacterium]